MKGYRDFDFHPVNYPIPEGHKFISTLHKKGLHWIPMVDAAIYIPNPENPADAYVNNIPKLLFLFIDSCKGTKHTREETRQMYFSEIRMVAFILGPYGQDIPCSPIFQLQVPKNGGRLNWKNFSTRFHTTGYGLI